MSRNHTESAKYGDLAKLEARVAALEEATGKALFSLEERVATVEETIRPLTDFRAEEQQQKIDG